MIRHRVICRLFEALALLMAVGLMISAWRIHAEGSTAALGLGLSGLCVLAVSVELYLAERRARRQQH